jgi:lipopolysaccharide export system permease protein
MNKVQRYLFIEVLRAAIIIVGGLALLALLAQGLSRTDLILENRSGALTYFYIVGLGAPQIIALLMPLALFVAGVWALNRIHKDSEIVVAQAAGMTRWQVASPILRLAMLFAVFHLGVNLWVQPTAQRAMRETVATARADLAAQLIRPGQFTTNNSLTFYAREKVGPELRGVLISDMTDPNFPTDILARSAELVTVDGAPTLLLKKAVSQQVDADDQLNVLEFDQYSFDLSAYMDDQGDPNLKASDRYLYELFFIDRKDYFQAKISDALIAEGHSRLASPIMNIVLGLLAVFAVLGGDFSRQGYSKRIMIATAVALSFVIGQLALQSSSANTPILNLIQWLLPIGTIGVMSYIYFGKGRDIGPSPSRQRQLTMNAKPKGERA